MSEQSNQKSNPNDPSVRFLYGTFLGRLILELCLFLKIPAILGLFLRSPFSRFYIKSFIKKNKIDMTDFSDYKESGLCDKTKGAKHFRSFNDFFTRKKSEQSLKISAEDGDLISPCDSLLSVFKIEADSVFRVKGFDYSLSDFFDSAEFSEKFAGGDCLIFRLCATDYHRFCFVDSGSLGETRFIPGKLYSVQPIACENYRVYTKNRRFWSILNTTHFGSVAQIEVGAFSVGGIVNHKKTGESFEKGEEKGFFDLHGSTIVLLFEREKISLVPEILSGTSGGAEFRVKYGQKIGFSKNE